MNLCQYLIVRVYRRVFHYFRDKVYAVNKGGYYIGRIHDDIENFYSNYICGGKEYFLQLVDIQL